MIRLIIIMTVSRVLELSLIGGRKELSSLPSVLSEYLVSSRDFIRTVEMNSKSVEAKLIAIDLSNSSLKLSYFHSFIFNFNYVKLVFNEFKRICPMSMSMSLVLVCI